MSEGLYYIIGGIKGGSRIKETVATLATRFSVPSKVLYLGAAHKNDLGYEASFFRSIELDKSISVKVSSLQLPDTTTEHQSELHAKAKKQFKEANIIFFDGGEVDVLENVFKLYELRSLCQQAFERGACVGGLCAGGSYLAANLIHSGVETEDLRIDSGAGLIPDTVMTCYIGDKAQRQRLYKLENESHKRGQTGVGVPVNQTITWNAQRGFQRLFKDTMGSVVYKPD